MEKQLNLSTTTLLLLQKLNSEERLLNRVFNSPTEFEFIPSYTTNGIDLLEYEAKVFANAKLG